VFVNVRERVCVCECACLCAPSFCIRSWSEEEEKGKEKEEELIGRPSSLSICTTSLSLGDASKEEPPATMLAIFSMLHLRLEAYAGSCKLWRLQTMEAKPKCDRALPTQPQERF